MSGQPPVPCDEACLLKFLLDSGATAERIQSVADDAKHVHRTCEITGKPLTKEMLDELPGLIKDQEELRVKAKALKDRWKKARGYKGQGL